MKPAVKTAITVTCILLAIALLNPPWTSGFESEKFAGFHLITGSTLGEYGFTAKIDYARLGVIVIAICLTSVAAYFIATSSVTHYIFSHLQYVFKPLAAVFSWLEKYWIWILVVSMFLKFIAFAVG